MIGRLVMAMVFLLTWSAGANCAPRTADPSADQQTQDTLFYLAEIPRRSTHNIITGQYTASAACCDKTKEIGEAGVTFNLGHTIAVTGQTPGLIGWDYNDSAISGYPKPVDYSALNSLIVSHARAGSLTTIGYHANNPWYGTGWNDTRCPGTLTDLIDPSKPVHAAWIAQLDHVAGGLQALQSRRVTVLWRPLLEMNGTFFWWGKCSPDQAQFRAVWKHMFDYFTITKGLHNLLWVYAQNQGSDRPLLYPGSDVVDIIGFDDYKDAITFRGYDNWLGYGKVMAFTERGPSKTDGSSTMFSSLIPTIAANKWKISFVQTWAYGQGLGYDPAAIQVMTDPRAANQPQVKAVMSCLRSAKLPADKLACVMR